MSGDASILSKFRALCERTPDLQIFTFLDDKGRDGESLNAGQLAAAAEAVAGALREWGFAPGDRVALCYPPSVDFVKGLLGCLVAGVIPVVAYPPNPLKLQQTLGAFRAVVTSAGLQAALTNGKYDLARRAVAVGSFFQRNGPQWPAIRWHRTDRIPSSSYDLESWPRPAADDIALLQYTSGSTGIPKGVIVTHGNLHHETEELGRSLDCDTQSRGVLWAPQFHNMGLVAGILSAVSGNGHLHMMSPLAFIERPALWFEVMSRLKATHTAAPNFALDLAVRKTTPEMRARWDLSALRRLVCGSEPIVPATVERFLDAFAAARLPREAFCPAYGLAEHTCTVSIGGRARLWLDREALKAGRVAPLDAGADGRAAVYLGCGRMERPGGRLRIVEPETGAPCAVGGIGEIWVNSPAKALGYYGMEEQTQETFRAVVAGEDDPTEYLRTGDLGFLHDSEIFITGRHKDLIILNGRNLYPQDLEDSLQDCHPLLRPGGIAAFSVDPPDGELGEQLVLFAECERDRPGSEEIDDATQAIRRRLFQEHQIACHTIVFGRPGLVPRTPGGKLRRQLCKQSLLGGEVQHAAATIDVRVLGTTVGVPAEPALGA